MMIAVGKSLGIESPKERRLWSTCTARQSCSGEYYTARDVGPNRTTDHNVVIESHVCERSATARSAAPFRTTNSSINSSIVSFLSRHRWRAPCEVALAIKRVLNRISGLISCVVELHLLVFIFAAAVHS